MDNLIQLHNWIMDEQNFLQIPNTKKYLSIVPEYIFKYRDENDRIVTSCTPVSTKLNCALQVGDDFVDFVEFYEESDFFNYLIANK